jgi:hypothetical protein
MEKRFLIIIGIIFVNIIFLISLLNASIGITPPKVEIDFKPNASYMVGFSVINVDPNQTFIVSLDGDFSEYAKVDKKFLKGAESFTVYIDLPKDGGIPGKKTIGVHVKENNNDSGGGGIGTLLEIVPWIVIKVPYPGKYGQIKSFFSSDANEGESFYFSLELENLGSEELEPNVNIEVYSDNKLLDKYNLGSKIIETKSVSVFEKTVNINKYPAGTYNVIAYVRLNDPSGTIIKGKTTLRVGSLFVDVINWTKEAYKDKINPFDIEVESKWNNNIKNIYAEVNVTSENGTFVDFFKTSPVSLDRWGKGFLNGFFNAENLIEGNYKANITLFYEDTHSGKVVDIRVVIPEIPKKEFIIPNYLIIIGIVSLIIIIVIAIMVIFFIRKSQKDYGRTKRKK